jgi:hypothetical protein
MNQRRTKNILEGIGFLAVIASLVFVGLETRNSANQTFQNTQAMEIAAYQDLTNNISEINTLSLQTVESGTLMAKAYAYDDTERWQLFSAFIMIFRHGDMAYFMFERGVIDEDRLHSILQPLPLRQQHEAGRQFWSSNKGLFVQSYQTYVDDLIADDFFR